MSLTVRPATPGDRARCLELLGLLRREDPRPSWRATYDALIDGDRGAVLVARDGGRLLGVATISFNLAIRYGGEYCQLEELFVDPVARGRNLGGLLVEAAIGYAARRGCAEMGLYLLAHTAANQPFYERCGFEVVGAEMRLALPRPTDG